MKIAYVKHPVTAEKKAEIRANGFRIVDARYAPEGVEIYGEPKRRAVKSKKVEAE